MGQRELFSVRKRSGEKGPTPAWTHVLNHPSSPCELSPRFSHWSGVM